MTRKGAMWGYRGGFCWRWQWWAWPVEAARRENQAADETRIKTNKISSCAKENRHTRGGANRLNFVR